MQQNTPERDQPEANVPHPGQAVPAEAPYTNPEWLCLVETPVKVARAIMAVSPSGALGMTQEIMALRQSMTEGLRAANQPLLAHIRQYVQRQDALEATWDAAGYAFGDRCDATNVRQTAISSCQQALSLLKKASATDAQAYKNFVYATALNVARAAKEGGFMGIGGEAVSTEEQALLTEISRTLGLQQ